MRKLPLILLTLATGTGFAGEAWRLPLFSSDPKAVLEQARATPVPGGADALVLDEQVTYKIDNSGLTTSVRRAVFRVVTDKGASMLSQISAVRFAWRQDEIKLRARVITPDGKPHDLDPKTISEVGIPAPAQGLFTDAKSVTAPLPALTRDSVIEAEVETREHAALDPEGTLQRWSPSPGIPLSHFTLTIEAPAKVRISAAWRNLAGVSRADQQASGNQRVVITGSDIPVTPMWPLAPPESAQPEIAFSVVPSWQQAANWYSGLVERLIGVTPRPTNGDISAKLTEINAILTDIHRKVRYTGIELGLAAYIPRTPAETLARGYGDCKDKSVLLVSRLRQAGIQAEVALVTPYPTPEVFPDVPGFEGFNHMVVYLPGPKPLWIDATAELIPAGRLPATVQGRQALIINTGSTGLVRTPVATADDNRVLYTFQLNLRENGRPDAIETVEPFGAAEDSYRTIATALRQSPDQLQRQMTQTANVLSFDAFAPSDWGEMDLGKPFRMTLRGTGYKRSSGSEQAVFADIPPFATEALLPLNALSAMGQQNASNSAAALRILPYYVPVFSGIEERWRLVPPPGFRVTRLPSVADAELGPFRMMRSVNTESDGSVLFTYRLTGIKNRFTPQEVRDLAAPWNKLLTQQMYRVEFAPEGTNLISEGKWKEGIEVLRRDAESVPPRANALLRYASALIQIGLRDKAIEIARKATEVDPKSAAAWGRLSFLYRHDALGRPDLPGLNYTESENAILKAIELAPTDKRYIAERALIQEMKSGTRYESADGLAEAIRLLESIAKDPPDERTIDLLPDALLQARRFQDVKAFYAREEGRRARPDYRIAAVAALDGGAAAVRESQALGQSETNRLSALRSAAAMLMQTGEYSRAADLYAAGPGSSAISSDLDMLRRTKRRGEAKLSDSGPIKAVQQVIYALLDPAAGPIDELYAPEWRTANMSAEQSQLLGMLAAYTRIDNLALWPRAIADIAVSNAELFAEGNDEIGYRVRFIDPTANGARRTLAWVARRGESYKILGVRGDFPSAGSEALALAAKGNLAGAKQWLNWVREDFASTPRTDVFAGLWPPKQDTADSVTAAAAALAASGIHYSEAVASLTLLRERTKDTSVQALIDQALAQGLSRNGQFVQAIPVWQRLYAGSLANTNTGINGLGLALILGGKPDEALKLVASIGPSSSTYPDALRLKARALEVQGKFKDGLAATLQIPEASRNPGDLNNAAWTTLFDETTAQAGLPLVERAVQQTQGRIPALLQTLASVQAEVGNLREARESILRYMSNRTDSDPGATYVMGRIAEQIGLPDAALVIYSAIPKSEIETGDSVYILATLRAKTLKASAATK